MFFASLDGGKRYGVDAIDALSIQTNEYFSWIYFCNEYIDPYRKKAKQTPRMELLCACWQASLLRVGEVSSAGIGVWTHDGHMPPERKPA